MATARRGRRRKDGGSIIQASNGNFYNSASGRGTYGYGVPYQITHAGTFTVLHELDEVDGEYPDVSLVQSPSGLLYGIAR
jgi:hypothetical protein